MESPVLEIVTAMEELESILAEAENSGSPRPTSQDSQNRETNNEPESIQTRKRSSGTQETMDRGISSQPPKPATTGSTHRNDPLFLPVHMGLCWRCGYPGHRRNACTDKPVKFCSHCGKRGGCVTELLYFSWEIKESAATSRADPIPSSQSPEWGIDRDHKYGRRPSIRGDLRSSPHRPRVPSVTLPTILEEIQEDMDGNLHGLQNIYASFYFSQEIYYFSNLILLEIISHFGSKNTLIPLDMKNFASDSENNSKFDRSDLKLCENES
ncbi:unnamed protein product [Ceutorhynchus assimilis]|uniref:CCHC-type domain-containing protein n=1 Tax=Ceutorhynchus assimilis TaxID=467358 RepID=A0A9N9QMZ1_9CUCU|nr:unnamed protein product [Ceutorhynchus assimilis]